MLTDLKLAAGDNVRIHEIYPPKLPDLFHGTQLVVIGRYTGTGHTGDQADRHGRRARRQEFVYELTFPEKTDSDTARTSSSRCGRGGRSATCSTRFA